MSSIGAGTTITSDSRVVGTVLTIAPPFGLWEVSSASVSNTGIVEYRNALLTVATGHGIAHGEIDAETAELLQDQDTMALLRQAEDDVRSGRVIDGDELRSKP